MTNEDKELLLKDLCSRLPYKVKVRFNYITTSPAILEGIDKDIIICDIATCELEDVKPYLRPMSSMTEEECDMVEEILGDKCIFDFIGNGDIILKQGKFSQNKLAELYDYYNSIHVDYRGLIEKGLAVAVTEENNPYK